MESFREILIAEYNIPCDIIDDIIIGASLCVSGAYLMPVPIITNPKLVEDVRVGFMQDYNPDGCYDRSESWSFRLRILATGLWLKSQLDQACQLVTLQHFLWTAAGLGEWLY